MVPIVCGPITATARNGTESLLGMRVGGDVVGELAAVQLRLGHPRPARQPLPVHDVLAAWVQSAGESQQTKVSPPAAATVDIASVPDVLQHFSRFFLIRESPNFYAHRNSSSRGDPRRA